MTYAVQKEQGRIFPCRRERHQESRRLLQSDCRVYEVHSKCSGSKGGPKHQLFRYSRSGVFWSPKGHPHRTYCRHGFYLASGDVHHLSGCIVTYKVALLLKTNMMMSYCHLQRYWFKNRFSGLYDDRVQVYRMEKEKTGKLLEDLLPKQIIKQMKKVVPTIMRLHSPY